VPPEARVVEREEAHVATLGGRYLFLGDADYPALLAELDDAPPALIALGRPELVRRSCIAMVGARNASAAACRFARGLALDLAREGAVVASGLARGIDAHAHEGALGAAPDGGTVAVIGCGPDVYFPAENHDLQRRVAEAGLLLTEYPPGTEPLARHFPQRNRIIAGLSAGTVVVEAAPRSGSLITARLAGEQGREVMAVPGHPSDPRAQGCNGLIRDGATLIQSAADVLGQVRPFDARSVRAPSVRWRGAPPEDATDAARRDVEALLSAVPVSVDELIRQSGHAPAAVQMVLVELELAGRLERHAGARVSLA
jgi:DNA processing protein